MDDVLNNLIYVNESMKTYIELSIEEMFFENDNVLKNNQKIEKNVGNSLKRAFQALINIIHSINEKITDTISGFFMSKGEKSLFDKYKEAIKSNPQTANTKITIKDFRKAMKAYDDAIQQADNAMQKDEDISKSNDIMDSLKKAILPTAITITMSGALMIAKNNKQIAENIKIALKKEEGICRQLENSVGKEQVDKFKTEVEKVTKKSLWERFKLKLFTKKQNDLSISLKETFSVIKSFIPNTKESKDPNKTSNQLDYAAKVMKDPKKAKAAGKVMSVASKAMRIKNNIIKPKT